MQKLVNYLECLQYWQAADNGMWEENMEIHASSIGACVAGLNAVKMLVNVNEELIKKGEETLRFLLPRESETKATDLALLSLIFPYRVVDRTIALKILEMFQVNLKEHMDVFVMKMISIITRAGGRVVFWLSMARLMLSRIGYV